MNRHSASRFHHGLLEQFANRAPCSIRTHKPKTIHNRFLISETRWSFYCSRFASIPRTDSRTCEQRSVTRWFAQKQLLVLPLIQGVQTLRHKRHCYRMGDSQLCLKIRMGSMRDGQQGRPNQIRDAKCSCVKACHSESARMRIPADKAIS